MKVYLIAAAFLLALTIVGAIHGSFASSDPTADDLNKAQCEAQAEASHIAEGLTLQASYDQCRATYKYTNKVLYDHTLDTAN